MITTLKPYPAYKYAGVPWLGQVPAHWEVRRIKTLFRENDERCGEPNALLLSLTRNEGIMRQSEASNRIASVEDLSKYKNCRFNDLVMNRMQAWSGMFAISSYNGVVSPDYSIFRPTTKSEVRYFVRLFKTHLLVNEFAKRSKGIGSGFNRLYTPDFGSVPIVVPPLPEQTAIVRFLDWAERRIRRVIRARQKRIALLQEYKQALIHQAVTGQIDVRTGQPYHEYKDSGVEWLGQVPAHWEVVRVKRAALVLRGKFTHRPRNDPSLYDGPCPFIQTGDVARAEKSIKGFHQTLNERGLAVSKVFPAGTLVMTIAANIGDVAVLDFEACFPDSIVGFVPRKLVERDFLYYVFRAMKSELLCEAPINTQGNLNIDRIGSRKIALPSINEQKRIVQQIEAATVGLHVVIDHVRQEISLLREYRTRLIADVVTGKLDVRQVAATLPEEPDADDAEVLNDEPGAEDVAGVVATAEDSEIEGPPYG